MYSNDRKVLRQRFIDAWQKANDKKPLDPLEAILVDIISLHPEYHPLLRQGEQALTRDWQPEHGETNPFLHMSLHVAVREMVLAKRPAGIEIEYKRLCDYFRDVMDAEHAIMDCLAEAMWQAQRDGREPDQDGFMQCVQQIGR